MELRKKPCHGPATEYSTAVGAQALPGSRATMAAANAKGMIPLVLARPRFFIRPSLS